MGEWIGPKEWELKVENMTRARRDISNEAIDQIINNLRDLGAIEASERIIDLLRDRNEYRYKLGTASRAIDSIAEENDDLKGQIKRKQTELDHVWGLMSRVSKAAGERP